MRSNDRIITDARNRAIPQSPSFEFGSRLLPTSSKNDANSKSHQKINNSVANLLQKESVEPAKKVTSSKKYIKDHFKSGTTRNDRNMLKNLDSSHTFSLKNKSNASASKLNKTSITTSDR